ncbi:hypothetical protein RHMOL_Rhmol10G0075100 [Rhododendron molle]|uniref:Uncharacterized protein n=1 Tax=Rhododendron molle TaxID=49168 RepID=A0ACC0M1F4_RHOML|nr:hypothetical protein RHMOL_Rhmol10G0075100 [Rhododendron molle]
MSNLWTGERYAQIVEVGFVGDQGQGRYGILFQVSFDEEGFVFPGAITITGRLDGGFVLVGFVMRGDLKVDM